MAGGVKAKHPAVSQHEPPFSKNGSCLLESRAREGAKQTRNRSVMWWADAEDGTVSTRVHESDPAQRT